MNLGLDYDSSSKEIS